MKLILPVMFSVIVLPLFIIMSLTPPGKVTFLICTFYKHDEYGRACNMLDQPLTIQMRKTEVRYYGSDNYRSTVTYVNIFNTTFDFIPNEIFKSFESIETLEIHNTSLSIIDENSFSNGGKIKTLFLTNNKIQFLEEKVFSHLKNLEILDLQGNQLKHLGEGLLSNNINLQQVNLKDNAIKSIDEILLKNLTKLRKLDLSGNICVNRVFLSHEMDLLKTELQSCYENAKNFEDVEKVVADYRQEKLELLDLEKLVSKENDDEEEFIPNSVKFYYFLVMIGYVLYNLWNKLVHGQAKKKEDSKED
jgi:hypothetical protein